MWLVLKPFMCKWVVTLGLPSPPSPPNPNPRTWSPPEYTMPHHECVSRMAFYKQGSTKFQKQRRYIRQLLQFKMCKISFAKAAEYLALLCAKLQRLIRSRCSPCTPGSRFPLGKKQISVFQGVKPVSARPHLKNRRLRRK